MSILFLLVLLAALSAAFSSFWIRKNSDYGGTVNGYLVIHFLCSALAAIALNGTWDITRAYLPMIAAGAVPGLLIALLMAVVGLCLKQGPAGLTFAFMNSGGVLPTLVLASLFGVEYGFSASFWVIAGSLVVIAGLLWGAQPIGQAISRTWLGLAMLTFVLQGAILGLYQWHCLLARPDLPFHFLILFRCSEADALWFMPGVFAAATAVQAGTFAWQERRPMNRAEVMCGMLGGLFNGVSTYFLLWTAEIANETFKIILFPLYAVMVISFCQLWGQVLYRERVNWWANVCCSVGILMQAK